MSRFLRKKRDKTYHSIIYKMPNIKQVWHFIYISLPKSRLSLARSKCHNLPNHRTNACQTTEKFNAKSPKIEIID